MDTYRLGISQGPPWMVFAGRFPSSGTSYRFLWYVLRAEISVTIEIHFDIVEWSETHLVLRKPLFKHFYDTHLGLIWTSNSITSSWERYKFSHMINVWYEFFYDFTMISLGNTIGSNIYTLSRQWFRNWIHVQISLLVKQDFSSR